MAVVEPRVYQRLIDGIANVVFVPVSWVLAVLGEGGPVPGHRSPYRVVIRNFRGQERAIAVVDDLAKAERERDEVVARIESIGVEAWAHEMRNRIPGSFFSPIA